MNNLFDVIEDWDLPSEEKPVKRNPKRGIEFRSEKEMNYKPQSQAGKVMVVTTEATYFVRPKNLDKFLSKLRSRQEEMIQLESERKERWEALEESNEPVPVIAKEKPKKPDYSDILITNHTTRELRLIVDQMNEREVMAYIAHYRRKQNRAPINVLKLRLEKLQETQG